MPKKHIRDNLRFKNVNILNVFAIEVTMNGKVVVYFDQLLGDIARPKLVDVV